MGKRRKTRNCQQSERHQNPSKTPPVFAWAVKSFDLSESAPPKPASIATLDPMRRGFSHPSSSPSAHPKVAIEWFFPLR